MTKTKKQSNSNVKTPFYKRWWMITVFVVILIAGIVAILVLLCRPFDREGSASGDTPAASKPTATTPSTDVPDVSDQPSSIPADKVQQYEGENPNQSADLTGLIAYKGVNGNILAISVVIDQFIQNEDDGICILNLRSTNSDNSYTASTDIQPEMSTSICQPFEVDISKLPSGHYNIDIELISGNKKGNIHDEVDL